MDFVRLGPHTHGLRHDRLVTYMGPSTQGKIGRSKTIYPGQKFLNYNNASRLEEWQEIVWNQLSSHQTPQRERARAAGRRVCRAAGTPGKLVPKTRWSVASSDFFAGQMSADYIRAVPTIDLTADELAAVAAAIRCAIEDDRFPRAPRASCSMSRGTGKFEAAAEPTPAMFVCSRDENKMSIPGFTAESSVFKSGCFRSTQPFTRGLTYESQVVVPARTARQICLPIVKCSSTAGQVSCWVEPCGIVIVVPGEAATI